jgi:hypothetical protein
MTRTTSSLFALTFAVIGMGAAGASAQVRPADRVPELGPGTLSSLLAAQERAIEGCAGRTDTGAYLAEVRATVRAGAPPATLFNSSISVTVRTRPRDGELEGCVRREVRDALQHAPYAVGPRAVSARHTFSIRDRPEPPEEHPAPPFSEAEVRQALDASAATFQRCLEVAGVPDQATLRIAVEADGRLVLTSADIPGGASQNALPCLARQVSRLRVSSRPPRRRMIVHTVALRTSARSW